MILLLELGRFTRDGAFLGVATLAWFSLWLVHLPWCRYLEVVGGFRPQPYADNLMCVRSHLNAFLVAARFITRYNLRVVQAAAPSVCLCVCLSVLLSVSRKDIDVWVISETGDREKVELDIRDLCKHETPPSGTGCSLYSTAMLRNLAVSPVVRVIPLCFREKLPVLRTNEHTCACMEWKLLPPPFLGLLLSGLLSPMPPGPLACDPWTEKRNGTKKIGTGQKKEDFRVTKSKLTSWTKKRVLDKKNGETKTKRHRVQN